MTDLKTLPAFEGENPATRAGVNEWHRIVTDRDWDKLDQLVTEDVTYHNPAQLEPYRGKEALTGILRLVFSIFEDFEYLRAFSGADSYGLEFKGRVGDSEFTGIDLVRFNASGKMTGLVVMLRPADVVAKLGAEAAKRMGGS